MEESKKTDRRGGARPGSGRKRGKKLGPYKSPDQLRVSRTFSISPQASLALDSVPENRRSKFIDEMILRSFRLKKTQGE
jgi:hypothetical protein